ncbi:hypothetical protein [Pseudomonas sp. SDO52101_S400]
MSNNLKLHLALIFASLLLGGCTPSPDDFPPILASVVIVTEAPSA